jgi:hypothetical protein
MRQEQLARSHLPFLDTLFGAELSPLPTWTPTSLVPSLERLPAYHQPRAAALVKAGEHAAGRRPVRASLRGGFSLLPASRVSWSNTTKSWCPLAQRSAGLSWSEAQSPPPAAPEISTLELRSHIFAGHRTASEQGLLLRKERGWRHPEDFRHRRAVIGHHPGGPGRPRRRLQPPGHPLPPDFPGAPLPLRCRGSSPYFEGDGAIGHSLPELSPLSSDGSTHPNADCAAPTTEENPLWMISPPPTSLAAGALPHIVHHPQRRTGCASRHEWCDYCNLIPAGFFRPL